MEQSPYLVASYITYAIPVFFLLIGLELLLDKMRHTKNYRFNDAITNLSCGIGSQITGVFIKVLLFVGYIWLYENASIVTMPHLGGDWSVGMVILTGIALFIGVDFFYYWFHRLAHEISVLWGSHIVHHQSEEYNLTVALRQAWVQGAFSWVFYLPLAVLGFHPAMFFVINQFQTLYQFWIHTKHIDKLHPAFEYVFNTPSHHRVHHGVNPKYIDRNHGGTLIIFDRMFGTFQAEEEEVVYGITKQPQSWNPILVNFQYWAELFSDVGRASQWSDKWNMLVKAPGWKPDELGGVEQPREVTPQTFHKYDTDSPMGLNYYILFQYIVILGGTTGFLFTYSGMPVWMQVALGALVIWSLVDLGGLFESRRWAFPLELLRLMVTASVFSLLTSNHQLFIPTVIIAAIYTIASGIWVARYRGVLTQKIRFAYRQG